MTQSVEKPNYRAKILAVDDRPNNLELLSTILTSQGYEVEGCDRGELAIELAEAIVPDLILLDASMPEMDGFSVCQVLKSDRHTKEIPVIFVTALEEIESKTKAFSLGGNDIYYQTLSN